MNTIDLIDTLASRAYDVDPVLLHSHRREERVAHARFIAISLRYHDGVSLSDISSIYRMNIESIRYALRKTKELATYNPPFARRYLEAKRLYYSGYTPFDCQLVAGGSHVRTRADSLGLVRCGIVITINENSFTVESFDDPTYSTINDRHTGRISPHYESSLDVVAIRIT